jgi:two-component system sensor histidine kinase UhpB
VTRETSQSGPSILWRVFTVNAAVLCAAVAMLVFSPATVHTPIKLTELVILVAGLLLTLLADLALLALVLGPVRKLARLMGHIDPMRPGQRAQVSQSQWAGSEVSVLAGALNTMLDRLETERRESARRALAAQEAERLRIARELHDEVGQTLTAVALQVERAAADPSDAKLLGEITAAIHTSLDDVRRIATELRPEALDDLGLTDALIALCLRIERQGAIRVTRELEGGLPRLGSEVELVIYRVAQEALTNAMRHSGASQVWMMLRNEPERVVLCVEDDGRGLSEEQANGGGLMGMRERAILIHADLSLDTGPAGGTRVTLALAAGERQLG